VSGGGNPPVASRDEAPIGALGDEISQKLKQFADVGCRNDQNLKIPHNSPPDC